MIEKDKRIILYHKFLSIKKKMWQNSIFVRYLLPIWLQQFLNVPLVH